MPELPEVETARSLIEDQALHRASRRSTTRTRTSPVRTRPASCAPRWRDARSRPPSGAARPSGSRLPGLEGSRTRARARHPPGHERPHRGHRPGWRGGRRRRAPGRDAQPRKPEWDRFTIGFADGGRLALFDKRRLGRVRLNPDVGALGPDAEEITADEFRRMLSKGTIAVKARLLDQSKIAGVGNLLADEALWQARISPAAPVNTLGPRGCGPAVPRPGGRAEIGRRPRRRCTPAR